MCWCQPNMRTPCCGLPKCHEAALAGGALKPGETCSFCHPPKPPATCPHGKLLEVIEADDAHVNAYRGAPCVPCQRDLAHSFTAKLIAEQNKALADRDLAHDAACELRTAKTDQEVLTRARETLRIVGLLAMACPSGVPSESLVLLLRAFESGSLWPPH